MPNFRVSLPLPPTVNHLYPTVGSGRRIKSREYRDWIKKAEETAFLQRFSRFPPDSTAFHLVLEVLFGNETRRQDATNRIKAVEDFVAKWMGYDDSKNAKLTLFKSHDPEAPRVDVIVLPYPGQIR